MPDGGTGNPDSAAHVLASLLDACYLMAVLGLACVVLCQPVHVLQLP